MNTTAFDQIKNDPRSTIEKLSSFKREANYDGPLFARSPSASSSP